MILSSPPPSFFLRWLCGFSLKWILLFLLFAVIPHPDAVVEDRSVHLVERPQVTVMVYLICLSFQWVFNYFLSIGFLGYTVVDDLTKIQNSPTCGVALGCHCKANIAFYYIFGRGVGRFGSSMQFHFTLWSCMLSLLSVCFWETVQKYLVITPIFSWTATYFRLKTHWPKVDSVSWLFSLFCEPFLYSVSNDTIQRIKWISVLGCEKFKTPFDYFVVKIPLFVCLKMSKERRNNCYFLFSGHSVFQRRQDTLWQAIQQNLQESLLRNWRRWNLSKNFKREKLATFQLILRCALLSFRRQSDLLKRAAKGMKMT